MEQLIEERDENVTTLTFSSPESKFSLELLEDLREALERIDTRGVVLAANENFSLGYDLEELLDGDQQTFHRIAEAGQEVCSLLENSPKVTASALSGYVFGPGLEVALATDFRFASDTSVLGFPEVRLGLLPSFGTMNRLPRIVGRNKSTRLLLTGGRVHAEEAQWLGLVDEVTETPTEMAQKNARSMAESPAALEAKRLLERSSLSEEREAFSRCCTEGTKDRIREFLESGSTRPGGR